MDIGPTELIIILVIVILLFGVGRIGKIAGELGSGLRAFKDGLKEDEAKPAGQPPSDKPAADAEIPDPEKSGPKA